MLEHLAKKIVQGAFDGQMMQGDDGQTYPVPGNYASKSRLVQGDRLKMLLMDDGRIIYKQVMPVRRRRVMGRVVIERDVYDHEVYRALVGDKFYNILFNSATYYRLKEGQEVSLIIPAIGNANWAAVDLAIKILDTDRELTP